MNTITNLEFSSLPSQHLIVVGGTRNLSGRKKDGNARKHIYVSLQETFLTFNGVFKDRCGDSFILITGAARIGCDRAVLQGIGGLMIQIKEGARIENPRDYHPGEVENLRLLLEVGSPIHRDPNRENFYEIEGSGETYYIHISPISGNVVLLAKWLRQSQVCCLSARDLVA
jgi:hypothetical protein